LGEGSDDVDDQQLDIVRQLEDARAEASAAAGGKLIQSGNVQVVINKIVPMGVLNYAYDREIPPGQAGVEVDLAAAVMAEQNRVSCWVLSPATQPALRDALSARGLYKRGENPAILVVDVTENKELVKVSVAVSSAGFGFDNSSAGSAMGSLLAPGSPIPSPTASTARF
jgi:hypothetical protein